MALEQILKVLDGAMKDRLEEVDTKLLEKRDVQDTLTTFFAEQQTRPELVAQIRAPSLMYEYLHLGLEEREELDEFGKIHLSYFLGEGEELYPTPFNLIIKSHDSRNFSRKIRCVNQLIKSFAFYFEHRKEGEVFNQNYLSNNRRRSLRQRIRRNFRDTGFERLMSIAAEIKPEIKLYTSPKEIFKIDGPKILVRIFESFLQERKRGQIFSTKYVTHFGKLGQNLYSNAQYFHLKSEGGYKRLLKLATLVKPELKDFLDRKSVLKKEGVEDLLEMFDLFLEEREEGTFLSGNYFSKNPKIRERFGTLGLRTYHKANRIFLGKHGLQSLIRCAAKKRPEIKNYISFRDAFKVDGPQQFIRTFEFYLVHRERDEVFNSNYLNNNEKLNTSLKFLGQRLYNNANNNFRKEGGIQYIVRLAAKKRPEILEYWSYDEKKGRSKK